MAIQWNDAAAIAKIEAIMSQRVTAACILVASHAKRLLSQSGVLTGGQVRGGASMVHGFREQFNKNHAYRMVKGQKQYLRLNDKNQFVKHTPFWLLKGKGKGKAKP